MQTGPANGRCNASHSHSLGRATPINWTFILLIRTSLYSKQEGGGGGLYQTISVSELLVSTVPASLWWEQSSVRTVHKNFRQSKPAIIIPHKHNQGYTATSNYLHLNTIPASFPGLPLLKNKGEEGLVKLIKWQLTACGCSWLSTYAF